MDGQFKKTLDILENYIINYEKSNGNKSFDKLPMYHHYFRDYLKYSLKYGDKTCVLYQVGSFYETYGFLDKKSGLIIGNYMEIGRDTNSKIGKENLDSEYTKPQLVGFPDKAIDKYLDSLIHNNYTVVLFNQTPIENKKDKYTRTYYKTISPSTYLENADIFYHSINKNILCLYLDGIKVGSSIEGNSFHCGFVNIDITSDESYIGELYSDNIDQKKIMDEIYRVIKTYNPCELVICYNNLTDGDKMLDYLNDWFSYYLQKSYCLHLKKEYKNEECQENILGRSFPINSFQSVFDYLEITKYEMATIAFVFLLDHLNSYSQDIVKTIKPPEFVSDKNLILENNTLTQLKILPESGESLYKYVNYTSTPNGARELQRRLTRPLYDLDEIKYRHDLVSDLINMSNGNNQLYKSIQQKLSGIGDISRLQRRINLGILKISELNKLNDYYGLIIQIIYIIKKHKREYKYLKSLLPSQATKIGYKKYRNAYLSRVDLYDESIKSGVDQELDKLRVELKRSETYAETVCREIKDLIGVTGKSTKDLVTVVYNDKDGVMLRITKVGYDLLTKKRDIIPNNTYNYFDSDSPEYLTFTSMKQYYKASSKKLWTLTPTVKEYKDKISTISQNIYNNLLTEMSEIYGNVMNFFFNFINQLDVAMSSSILSIKYSYCRPELISNVNRSSVAATKVRNPIGEQIWRELYVTNDVDLSEKSMILYGLNSVGKSNLIKAMAMNIIMAQSGLYTSATSFTLAPYKNIFTRIGNTDSYRYSSFQMECLDIRSIIKRSDKHTFAILDELTASTEHLSALSISYATIKKLHSNKVTFMFATHITELSDVLKNNPLPDVAIKHLSIHFDHKTNKIIFDRKLKDGNPDKLYGIEVAKSMMIDDKEFIDDAFAIREKMIPKASHYNKNAIMMMCDVCGSTDRLEEHHINQQALADNNGIIDIDGVKFNKNIRGNLCCLCAACHNRHHHHELNIIGWKMSSQGLYLDYE